MAFGLSATAIAGLGSAALGAYSASKGSKQSGNATTTQQQQMDPRIADIVFGKNGANDGLLSQYQALGNAPSNPALKQYGDTAGQYLNQNAGADMAQVRNTGYGLGTNQAPAMPITNWAVGNMVQAPKQNNMDLSGAYNRFVNGTPGANPYLDQGIQGAIAQNKLGFQQMLDDSNRNLTQNILPGIGGGAIAAGQYGSSRQGIAEGQAIADQQRELNRAASQFGQNATNAAVNAKANAYDTDSNRALSATQGLGAQQYGVAQQDAATKNQAEFMNVGNSFNANQTNAQLMGQNNALNQQGQLAGAGLLSGNLNNAYGAAAGQDLYGLQKAGMMNGLLTPYLSANQSQTTSQPIYQNQGANALGGALGGLGLYNGLNKSGALDGIKSFFGPGTIGG